MQCDELNKIDLVRLDKIGLDRNQVNWIELINIKNKTKIFISRVACRFFLVPRPRMPCMLCGVNKYMEARSEARANVHYPFQFFITDWR
jgi:hypothetical protein